MSRFVSASPFSASPVALGKVLLMVPLFALPMALPPALTTQAAVALAADDAAGAAVALAADADAAAGTPAAAAWVALLRGDQSAARERAVALLEDDATDLLAAVVLAQSAASGDSLTAAAVAGRFTDPPAGEAARAVALVGLAALARESGDAARADSLLALAEGAIPTISATARVVYDLQRAATWSALAQMQPAAEAARAALAGADSMGNAMAGIEARLLLGRVLIRSRDLESAAAYLDTALSRAVALDLPLWEGEAALARSVVNRFGMDLDGAVAFRRQALAAFERCGDRRGQAQAQQYIGTISAMRGRYAAAIRALQAALALARETGARTVEAQCLGDLAGVNYMLGDIERALDQNRQAAALTDHPLRRGYFLVNTGLMYATQQRYREALAYYEQGRELLRQAGSPRLEAVAIESIGWSLVELGEIDRGLEHLATALDLVREYQLVEHEPYILHYRAVALMKKGDWEAAAAAWDEAVELAQAAGAFDIVEAALLGRARLARRQGQLDVALAHLESALAVVHDVRRRSGAAPAVQSGFFAESANTFEEAIDLLYELHGRDPTAGYAARAFDLAQEAKARSFLDLLSEAEVHLRFRADPRYREREAALLERLAELDGELEAAAADAEKANRLRADIAAVENELEVLDAELRVADPRYAELRHPRPATLEQVQSGILRSGETLLEYALGDSASYVWRITNESATMTPLPPRAAIESAVNELRDLLVDYNITGEAASYYVPVARRMFALLLEPTGLRPADTDHLIIAPDGILHYLPFEALVVAEPTAGEAARYADLPFLVDEVLVSYVPSASVLQRLRQSGRGAPRKDRGFLLVGDPAAGGREVAGIFARAAGAADPAPLPYARRELDGIAALAAPNASLELTGADATYPHLRDVAAGASFASLHLATHGLFNEARPQYSGLILGPDAATGDDGFVTVSDVFGLELDCDQVVLSACSSALGEEVTGEGIIGLTRAFLFAGSRRVVSALWDVSGAATADLMQAFYRHETAGESATSALSAAKREFLRDSAGERAHPYFWAGFVVAGDGR